MATMHDFEATKIDGAAQPLSDFAGKVAVVVNVASKCGFTPQYDGLEALYRAHKDDGLVVLGFPCNQFGAQEPGDEKEIAEFCSLTYDVSFPMFAKIDVNGTNTHPLYEYLKKAKPGFAGSTAVKWNFTKFLVDADGRAVRRYAPQDKPKAMEREIKKLLAAAS
ncbi:MAG: glutathione peroxidase [Pseudomonadota bacterium]